MREIARSVGTMFLSSCLALALLLAVAEVQGTFEGDHFSLSLTAGTPGRPRDLAAAVVDSGKFAIAGSTAALLVVVAAFVWLRVYRKPDPHVDFTATDGSHVQLRLSMPPNEINENVQRIRAQLEMFEKAAAQPASQDR
jgi:hypothetical protein